MAAEVRASAVMKITVLDDEHGVVCNLAALNVLEGLPVTLQVHSQRIADETELIAALRGSACAILVRERTRITVRTLDAVPELKLIVVIGHRASQIDVDACRRRGIEVQIARGDPVVASELTWTLILAASRRLVPFAVQRPCDHGRPGSPAPRGERLGRTLHGRTLGVWALGRVGARVAAIGHAFGMQVLVHGGEQSRRAARAAGYRFIGKRRAFLGAVDVLSLHLPPRRETLHLIGESDLAAMRADALLVNTSHPELLAPGALLAALGRGRPGAAALDVHEDEPATVAAYRGHPAILFPPQSERVNADHYEASFREAFGHVRLFIEAQLQGRKRPLINLASLLPVAH